MSGSRVVYGYSQTKWNNQDMIAWFEGRRRHAYFSLTQRT